jgi:orotidine-5'-phosphate decarboxylase
MLQDPTAMQIDPRDRLIVALDFSSVEAAQAMVARLGDAVSFYKIGYQLGFAGGIGFCATLTDAGKQVFVDLKLHDIGNTVAQGVKSVARLGATFLTVHAYPQTMQAAVEAREGACASSPSPC